MKRLLLTVTGTLLIASAAAQATPGRLGTLPHGIYACSLPGDASGPAWRDLPDMGFTISNASTYRTPEGAGTYLLTGKNVTFTRGPLKGKRFVRSGSNTLRWVDDNGEPGRIRCVRRGGTG